MLSRSDAEDFLYREAAFLDEWQLSEWLSLWADDGRYLVPMTADGSRTSLHLIADDLADLRSRVHQLQAGTAWTEVPRSHTCHMVTNVRVIECTATSAIVRSVFTVHRSRGDRQDLFAGSYEHELCGLGASMRIRRKVVRLAHGDLIAQAKVSILL